MDERLRGLGPALSGEQGARLRVVQSSRSLCQCLSHSLSASQKQPSGRHGARNLDRLLRHFGRPNVGTAGPGTGKFLSHSRAPLSAALPAPGPNTQS